MLTDAFYSTLAALVKSAEQAPGAWYLAIGGGDPAWDRQPPLIERHHARLTKEFARKAVAPGDIQFIGADNVAREAASSRLCLRVRFDAREATGTLREVGLFAGASAAPDSGVLLSYFTHPPLEKTVDMSLERVVRLDLTPRAVTGVQPTRYLGNSHSREVHDLENLNKACQVGEIRFDRRIFFGTAEQAAELGYDLCAFCFGRQQSKR